MILLRANRIAGITIDFKIEIIKHCIYVIRFFRLPIVQGGTFAFLTPTFAILSLPQWKCPTLDGEFECYSFSFSFKNVYWIPRKTVIASIEPGISAPLRVNAMRYENKKKSASLRTGGLTQKLT